MIPEAQQLSTMPHEAQFKIIKTALFNQHIWASVRKENLDVPIKPGTQFITTCRERVHKPRKDINQTRRPLFWLLPASAQSE